jgi:protein MpaA
MRLGIHRKRRAIITTFAIGLLGSASPALAYATPVPTPPDPTELSIASVPAPKRPVQVRREVIGTTSEGRAIDAYCVGSGPYKVLIAGGIHGGYEANTVDLVNQMTQAFIQNPDWIPDPLTLVFVADQNPDGFAEGQRFSSTGIDLNRNWPTRDWSANAFNQDGKLTSGLGGAKPLSEPETSAMHKWVVENEPVGFISYHSAAGEVYSGLHGETLGLNQAYSKAAGYPAQNFETYPVTGDFLQWIDDDTGVPGVECELTTHSSIELSQHLAGVRAVLPMLAGNAVLVHGANVAAA